VETGDCIKTGQGGKHLNTFEYFHIYKKISKDNLHMSDTYKATHNPHLRYYTNSSLDSSTHAQSKGINAETITQNATPCGGGIEYLHHSPVSSKRRQKGTPVPGVKTGPSFSWGI
jgi:hypothetical protein